MVKETREGGGQAVGGEGGALMSEQKLDVWNHQQ